MKSHSYGSQDVSRTAVSAATYFPSFAPKSPFVDIEKDVLSTVPVLALVFPRGSVAVLLKFPPTHTMVERLHR